MTKFKFIEPALIKAGDDRVKLGIFNEYPKVDCRVLSEETYQELKKAYDNECNGNPANSDNANCAIFDVSNLVDLLTWMQEQNEYSIGNIDMILDDYKAYKATCS